MWTLRLIGPQNISVTVRKHLTATMTPGPLIQ